MKAMIIHHEAEAEIIMATQFYEVKSEKVAARFVDEIEHALQVVAASPQRSLFFHVRCEHIFCAVFLIVFCIRSTRSTFISSRPCLKAVLPTMGSLGY